MSDWDRDTIGQHLDQLVSAQTVPRARSIEFEALSAAVVLSEHGLTDEELEGGIIGGSRDGALDAVYVFVDGALIREDSDYLKDKSTAGKNLSSPTIRVELVQAKESNGFSENAVILAARGASDLLNVDRDENALRGQYSEEVIEATGRFVTVNRALRLNQPKIEVAFSYASTADESSVHQNVQTAFRGLEKDIAARVYGAKVTGGTIGIEAFIRHLRKRPSYSGELVADELTPHERPESPASWLTLVSLKNYIAFLTDPDGSYRDYLFTDNVRDYNPSAPVNRDIVATLRDPDSPEFWWLNNGVTIVCSKVYAPGKRVTIEDIQIVNGLQTSQSIWNALKDAEDTNAILTHCVLVRVIPTPDRKVRNMVIRATNSQTPVKDEGLRATSDIQMEIEDILLESGYFYDRRRNYYRNLGMDRSRIIGIRELAQHLLTWIKFRPDDARARPNDYIKSDAKHDNLFSRTLPKSSFGWALDAQAQVDLYLAHKSGIDAAERNDLRFLLAAVIAKNLAPRRSKVADQLVASGAPASVISTRRLGAAYKKVTEAIEVEQAKDKKIRRDQLVKNRVFVDSVLGSA
jgi:hypothetical protein